MGKIKEIALSIISALSLILFAVVRSKDKKIKKQKEEIDKQESKLKEQKYINEAENEAKKIKSSIANKSNDDINRMLDEQGALRD